MTELTGIGVFPAASPEEAVKDMDIIVTATTSKEPVFKGEWLSKGTHINAIGANFLSKQEIDVETVRRSACVVVDSLEQAMLESGDLDRAAKADAFYWEDARELGLVIVGDFPGGKMPAKSPSSSPRGLRSRMWPLPRVSMSRPLKRESASVSLFDRFHSEDSSGILESVRIRMKILAISLSRA